MPSSSNVHEARRALGLRLRAVREQKGLTAKALAQAAGWSGSKVSRVELGKISISEADLRVWVLHCGATTQAEELITAARGIKGMYVEWRDMEEAGLRYAQEHVRPQWEETRRFRAYSPSLVPGPLQTSAYTRAVLSALRDRRSLPDDLDSAVQTRMERQKILTDGDRKFAVLLEESVLYHRIGDTNEMAAQLGRLLEVSTLPSVSLGIIPRDVKRSAVWPTEEFWVFDSRRVNVELVSAYLTITQPHEIAMYAKVFGEMAQLAQHGEPAYALIGRAVATLG